MQTVNVSNNSVVMIHLIKLLTLNAFSLLDEKLGNKYQFFKYAISQ